MILWFYCPLNTLLHSPGLCDRSCMLESYKDHKKELHGSDIVLESYKEPCV